MRLLIFCLASVGFTQIGFAVEHSGKMSATTRWVSASESLINATPYFTSPDGRTLSEKWSVANQTGWEVLALDEVSKKLAAASNPLGPQLYLPQVHPIIIEYNLNAEQWLSLTKAKQALTASEVAKNLVGIKNDTKNLVHWRSRLKKLSEQLPLALQVIKKTESEIDLWDISEAIRTFFSGSNLTLSELTKLTEMALPLRRLQPAYPYEAKLMRAFSSQLFAFRLTPGEWMKDWRAIAAHYKLSQRQLNVDWVVPVKVGDAVIDLKWATRGIYLGKVEKIEGQGQNTIYSLSFPSHRGEIFNRRAHEFSNSIPQYMGLKSGLPFVDIEGDAGVVSYLFANGNAVVQYDGEERFRYVQTGRLRRNLEPGAEVMINILAKGHSWEFGTIRGVRGKHEYLVDVGGRLIPAKRFDLIQVWSEAGKRIGSFQVGDRILYHPFSMDRASIHSISIEADETHLVDKVCEDGTIVTSKVLLRTKSPEGRDLEVLEQQPRPKPQIYAEPLF